MRVLGSAASQLVAILESAQAQRQSAVLLVNSVVL